MSLLNNTRISSWARGHLLCRVDGVSDRFAVTFDDGPDPRATERILEVLAAFEAHATFFMLGSHVRRDPNVAAAVVREGHEAAVHGDSHWPLPLLLPRGIRKHVLRCSAAIEDATGAHPCFYRAPFGFMSPGQARFVRRLGYRPVLGDIYPGDPHRPGVERIARRVISRLAPGSILILHDGSPIGLPDRSQTIAALRIILEHASSRGLRGVTLGELVPTH